MIVDLDVRAAPNERRLAGVADDKTPLPGAAAWHATTTLESGATFLVINTGEKFILMDRQWEPLVNRVAEAVRSLATLVDEVATETRRLNGHLTVGSDLGSKEALELAQG